MKTAYFIFFACIFFLISCADATKILIVGPAQTACAGAMVKKCLQIKQDSLSDWKAFAGNIQGFDYEPGFTYTLAVLENVNPNQESEGPVYVLKEVIKKEKEKLSIPDGNFDILTFREKPVAEEQMTINFNTENEQVNGKGVCNRYTGTFTTTGTGKIKFSPAATTRMMCKEPELERDFFQAISLIDKFELHENTLTLKQGDSVVMTATLKTEG